MALKFANNAVSTLVDPIDDTQTTIEVEAGHADRFPTLGVGDWHPVTVVAASGPAMEVMRVTGRTGAVLTVVRAQEGTAAQAFAAGARVDFRITAAALEEVADRSIDPLPEVSALSGGEELALEHSGALHKVKVATAAEIRADTAGRLLSNDEVWDAAAGADLGNLTGTVALDFSDFLGLAYGTATGNITLGEPTNLKPGQTVVLEVTQDGTGGRTLSLNTSFWLTSEGEAIEWDTTAGARNVLIATVLRDGKVLLAVAGRAVA